MFIYSHNPNSEGAKALKDALSIKKIKNEGSSFKGSMKKTVLNWGSSVVPDEVLKCNILNHPEKIKLAANKLSFFKTVSNHYPDLLPPWTEFYNTAVDWVGEGFKVCARTILNGHSGAGIVLMSKDDEVFPKAPLYVRYIPKVEEYRVHVVLGNVIDVQRKTLSKDKLEELGIDAENINWKIRNLANGFIYQRANVNPNQEVLDASVKIVQCLGLDFGAVDVIVGKKDGKTYVLEVNTAPGLTGSTVESYVKAFKDVK